MLPTRVDFQTAQQNVSMTDVSQCGIRKGSRVVLAPDGRVEVIPHFCMYSRCTERFVESLHPSTFSDRHFLTSFSKRTSRG